MVCSVGWLMRAAGPWCLAGAGSLAVPCDIGSGSRSSGVDLHQSGLIVAKLDKSFSNNVLTVPTGLSSSKFLV